MYCHIISFPWWEDCFVNSQFVFSSQGWLIALILVLNMYANKKISYFCKKSSVKSSISMDLCKRDGTPAASAAESHIFALSCQYSWCIICFAAVRWWANLAHILQHYNDVMMRVMASQITSLMIVYSNVYSGAVQRKHQSTMSLAFIWGIHQWPVNSLHKRPVTWNMFPFDDVIMRVISMRLMKSLFLSM